MTTNVLIQATTLEELLTAMAARIQCAVTETQKINTQDNQLLTEKEASDILKVSRQTLKKWRDAGLLPYERIGKAVRYSKNDLLRSPKSGQS